MPLLSHSLIQRLTLSAALLTLTSATAIHAQTFNWVQQTFGTLTLNAIAYSPERAERLAVGNSGALITSPDAVMWTSGSSGTTSTLNGVAWGSGQYVTVGIGGIIRTSPDGATWTSRTSGTTSDLLAVAWISPSTTGTGQWIAVGSEGTILTSLTGVTWTKRTSGVENMNRVIRGVTWANPQNTSTGLAIVVGDNGTILTSVDGITWTSRSSGTSMLYGVVWTGTQAMAVGSNGTVLTSTNTTSWTTRNSGNNFALQGVAWAPATGSGRFVTGGSSTNSMTTSTDGGANWTQINLNNSTLKHAVWDGSHFIALGTSGRMVLSHDGTLPTAPSLKSPVDSALNVSLSPSLNWSPVSTIKTYHIQVSTVSSFNTTVLNDTSVADTTRLSVSLSDTTVYYWRVRGRNVAGFGTWSTTRRFKTLLSPPPQALLSSPAHKATGIPVYTDLSFAGLGAATGYQLHMALDSTFSTLTLNDSTIAAQPRVRAVGPLAFNTTYYWRVRGYNTGGNGPWSAIRSFTTEATPTGAPTAPILVAPAIFATNVALSPTFTWNVSPGTLSYQLQLSTVATFATNVVNDSSLIKTTLSGILLNGSAEYFWRVRAKNSFGNGPWSEINTFTTIITAPEIPALTTPAAFASAIAGPINLTWATARGATTYHVQLSLNPEFSSFVMRDSAVTELSKSSGNLVGSTPYYWRVRAKNSAGISEWTATRRFTTAAVQIVALTSAQNTARHLNVANNRINFNLANPERVTIRVFDLRGENSMELVNGVMNAGSHAIRIPSSKQGGLRFLVFNTAHANETVTLAP